MTVRQTLSLMMGLLIAMGSLPAQDPSMTIEDLRMVLSRALVIDYPADIRQISVSNPDVVEAVTATSREFLLNGKGIGNSTVIVWAKNGQRTMYNITVDPNMDPIRKLLRETFPNEQIQAQAGRDSVTLTGVVSSKEVSDRAVAMLSPLAKSVVSDLRVATPVAKQIVLKVRFAELNRSYAYQFGNTLLSTGFLNTYGQVSTQQFGAAAPSSIGGGAGARWSLTDALNVFAFRPDLDLAVLVKVLSSQGFLQILAEPNVVTSNGTPASFLVGGEFPVPVLQGGANAGAVTVQFREFGIRLSFNPLITPNGTIKLYVKPEVSTIDLANSVTVSGFVIPALATKRIETNIELGPGQSFVIGGLLDDRVNETLARLPGLSNIPVLGSIFRSRSEQRSKSELIILVTPEIVVPLEATDPKPSPVWPKPFLDRLQPGDKFEGVFKPGTVPTVAEAENKAPKAPVDPAKSAGKDDGGPLAKLKFWGRDKDKDGAASKDPKAKQTAQGVPAITPIFQGGNAPAHANHQPAGAPASVAGGPDPAASAPASPAPNPVVTPDPVTPDPVAAPAAPPSPASPAPSQGPGSNVTPQDPAPSAGQPAAGSTTPDNSTTPQTQAPAQNSSDHGPAGNWPVADPAAASEVAAHTIDGQPSNGASAALVRRPAAAALTSLPANVAADNKPADNKSADNKPADKGGN